jgi:hypothetical protein
LINKAHLLVFMKNYKYLHNQLNENYFFILSFFINLNKFPSNFSGAFELQILLKITFFLYQNFEINTYFQIWCFFWSDWLYYSSRDVGRYNHRMPCRSVISV